MLQSADTAVRSHHNLQRCWLSYVAPWAIGLALTGMMPAGRPVLAQSGSETVVDFSIPSQPLASALGRYGDATGNEALYEGGLADGRLSADVQGRLTPAEALQRLLAGTGLVARFVAEGTFVLAPAPQHKSKQAMPAAHQRYYALIQEDVLDTLCRLHEARPNHYRLVTVFWIAQNGAVEDLLRVGTSGNASTDQLIDQTLGGLKFREPPPADFVQPVRLLFVPQGPGVNPGCATADARLRAHGAAP
ncbi:STN domain-containing protein [Bradyrhizobium sp. 31Argb]|uniref:STN domain-containing protein n=1 Tax=Bradyrhizobium sp. 31Argb TaxID=3141247 RepID=UPI00374A3FFE